MSVYDDLTYGHGYDEILTKLDELLPGSDADEVSFDMIKLVLLDEHLGLSQPGDYVLISPASVWAIAVLGVQDPVIAKAFCEDEESASASERATNAPFEVKIAYNPALFESPEDCHRANSSLPANLRGRVLRVRLMRADETKKLPPMLTVRADGKVIYLPSGPTYI